ncbi:hypothetical protein SAMN05421780_10453 [Flexibacter flexilis DSM 6793]|uniref:SnoaL-like domain-containing protein n=1 Tax=Flexibacter flexilis DSM 6793 TaxID=927664 RepID=A0A1I1HQE7_9BACT|nr:hypothetical protein [Flexibacter flexilis]SFC26144.1 hypothetical protein SAMN05421780_10453 [Flexibacter flexilis DSM 6793]
MDKKWTIWVGLLGLMLGQSCNPFAPSLDDAVIDRAALLGNRQTVKGMFEWFRNSYELRDTLMYGQIIGQNFKFTYKNFANNNDEYWDRASEMRSTSNMFRSVKSTTLQWTNYVIADTLYSDTLASVERYFNLTIVQDDQNIYRGTGSAKLTLVRNKFSNDWQIVDWYDKSDF